MIYTSSAAATRTTLVAFHTTTVPATNKSPEPESITEPPPLALALTPKVLTDLESELIDRPYAKLAREAERVKAISSVNAEVNAGVGGMLNGGDFKTTLERKAFDKATEDLELYPPGWKHPRSAGSNRREECCWIASASFMIRRLWTHPTRSAKLANNVDADEACVLSTAFYGASPSRQFRAEPVQGSGYRCSHNLPGLYWREQVRGREPSQDQNYTSPYQVRNRDRKDLDSEAPATFRCRHWIQGCEFPTLQYKIMGAKAAYHNLTERGAIDAAVKLTVLCSESDWRASLRLQPSRMLLTLDTDSSTISASEGTKRESELKKPAEKLPSSEMTPSLEPVITKPRSLEEKKAGRERLVSSAAASTKHEREEAFNALKGFPYRFRCLPSGLGESLFNGFSIAGKRAKVKAAIHGSMNPSPMQMPKKSRPSATRSRRWKTPSGTRYNEAETGPQALKDLQHVMSATAILNERVNFRDGLAWDEGAEYGSAAYEEAGGESFQDDDEYDSQGQDTGDSQVKDLR
ncbi:hypothetical protein RSOLAG22IIIB_06698 [Rhizoctonia solani]|uniref:Uncharacterized protein n=1 Tax=Rhizoctonia solani TaxID=456999 RepID=A0A0K6GGQ9_9AGAM|nr:hypothetical protein RSOLAG22IIIB_06698 [Rhizoctonia solani]